MLVLQSCPTLCDPMGCSPQGSSVHGIPQARILEWVTIPFSRGSSWPKHWTQVFCTAGRFFTIWAIGDDPNQVYFNTFQYWNQVYFYITAAYRILVVACKLFSFGMWDLVPWPGIEPRPSALEAGAWSLNTMGSPHSQSKPSSRKLKYLHDPELPRFLWGTAACISESLK